MRPPEVLDQQAALIDYLDSRAYRTHLTNFLADMVRKGKIGPVTGDEMADILITSLKAAQAFHVQADMMPLIRSAAMDLEADDTLVHSRLPAEHGFLVFDAPWITQDVWGKQVSTTAIQWRSGVATMDGRSVPGIYVTQFADINDERDETSREILAEADPAVVHALGRLHISALWFLAFGEPIGPTERPTSEMYAQFATGDLVPAASYGNPPRTVVALFRLLNQVLVDVADAPIDRATLRRISRKRLPVRVQTVKLRRKERQRPEETHGEGAIEWQHSWVVRGHWAWRKCRADHPLAEEYEKGWHARVYVAPYFKGPDDRPLKISEKVWGLAQ